MLALPALTDFALTCLVRVYASLNEAIIALTDDGTEELKDIIQAARINTKNWHEFLDGFVDDADLISRIKAQEPL